MVSLLTSDLKEIGEKNDGFCSFAPVWPEPKQRACEQPAQTESRQTQTQEVRRGLQNLQIAPYCRQDDSWGHPKQMTRDERGRQAGRFVNDNLVYPQKKKNIWTKSDASVMCEYSQNTRQIFIPVCSNETIISCLQVYKAVKMNLPYSTPLSINISPMVKNVRFLFWWLSIVLSSLLPSIRRPLSAHLVQKCCSELQTHNRRQCASNYNCWPG